MPRYRPGELDQRIELLEPVSVDDGYGGQTTTWQVYKKIFAKVKPMSGGEGSQHGQLADKAQYLFVIRNRSDIKATHAIRWNGLDFNIRFPKAVSGREMYMEIAGEAGVAL